MAFPKAEDVDHRQIQEMARHIQSSLVAAQQYARVLWYWCMPLESFYRTLFETHSLAQSEARARSETSSAATDSTVYLPTLLPCPPSHPLRLSFHRQPSTSSAQRELIVRSAAALAPIVAGVDWLPLTVLLHRRRRRQSPQRPSLPLRAGQDGETRSGTRSSEWTGVIILQHLLPASPSAASSPLCQSAAL